LHNYTEWRDQVSKTGDIFEECEQIWQEAFIEGFTIERKQRIDVKYKAYCDAYILCPFLYDGSCLIYEVRPYTCVAYYATTPPEWCSPDSKREPRIFHTMLMEAASDLHFYYGQIAKPIFLFMPLSVYRILKEGYSYLSKVTGVSDLESKAMKDAQVKQTYCKYLRS
jgi:Fe-S-cluster containining protein